MWRIGVRVRLPTVQDVSIVRSAITARPSMVTRNADAQEVPSIPRERAQSKPSTGGGYTTRRRRKLPRTFESRRGYNTSSRFGGGGGGQRCKYSHLAAYSHTTPIGDWSIPRANEGSSTIPVPKPAVAYTRDHDEAEELLQCIPLGSPLGFDLEWNFDRRTGATYKTALLQICSSSLILILQLSSMKGIPARLRTLLQDPHTIKAGVAIRADCTRLKKDFNVEINGILELSSLARKASVEKFKGRRGLISLQELCAVYLDRRLVKDEVRCSDWTAQLSSRQVEYAASDAYVALEILGKICGILDSQPKDTVTKVKVRKSKKADKTVDRLDDMALMAFLGEERSTSHPVGVDKGKSKAMGGSSLDAIEVLSESEESTSDIQLQDPPPRPPLRSISDNTDTRVTRTRVNRRIQTEDKENEAPPAKKVTTFSVIQGLLHHHKDDKPDG